MYNPNERRKDILIAALEIFGRDGFYKAKVIDIAKAANIGKGTIYEYFDSKKSLFEEMIKFCIEEYTKEIKRYIGEKANPIEKLKRYILFERNIMIKYGNIASIFINEGDKIGKEIKKNMIGFRDSKLAQVEEIIREGIEKGLFRAVDSKITALMFMGGAHQIIADELVFCMTLDDNKIILKDNPEEVDLDTFLSVFLNGIVA